MQDTFSSAPRASTAVRATALAIGLVGLALAVRTTLTSLDWVDRPFPGFFVLTNRVIPSIGLGSWPSAFVPGLYQSEVRAVDGHPVESAQDVYDRALDTLDGRPITYTIRKKGVDREIALPSAMFTARDWFFTFGAYLLDAAVYLTCGLIAWVLRPTSPLSRAFLAFGASYAAFFLTAMDLYGPGTLTRVHATIEALTPAAALQLVMLFPQPHR